MDLEMVTETMSGFDGMTPIKSKSMEFKALDEVSGRRKCPRLRANSARASLVPKLVDSIPPGPSRSRKRKLMHVSENVTGQSWKRHAPRRSVSPTVLFPTTQNPLGRVGSKRRRHLGSMARENHIKRRNIKRLCPDSSRVSSSPLLKRPLETRRRHTRLPAEGKNMHWRRGFTADASANPFKSPLTLCGQDVGARPVFMAKTASRPGTTATHSHSHHSSARDQGTVDADLMLRHAVGMKPESMGLSRLSFRSSMVRSSMKRSSVVNGTSQSNFAIRSFAFRSPVRRVSRGHKPSSSRRRSGRQS